MTDYLTGRRFEVQVVLDKPRLLRFDFNAYCRAEEPAGVSFLDWDGDLTATRLKALVWAAIVYEPNEERLTLDQVGDALNATFLDVMATITEGIAQSMPDPVEREEPADPQKTATAPS